MLDILSAILCWLENLGVVFLNALIKVANLIILGVGDAVVWAVGLLPAMPAFPAPPDAGVLGWLNWALPIAGMVTVLSTVLSVWLVILGVRIIMSWLKAM